MNVMFAYSCGLSKQTVEPLYTALKSQGIPCAIAPRGKYEDLATRLAGFTHYVYGIGEDKSWEIAKSLGMVTIYVQHGQYITGSWIKFVPDYYIVSGQVYAQDIIRNKVDPKRIFISGYFGAQSILKYRNECDGSILVTLPHVGEHKHLKTMDTLKTIAAQVPITVRIHPRNSGIRNELAELGILIDETPSFMDSLSKAKCLISGPSNCIIEASACHVPVALLTGLENPSQAEQNMQTYFAPLAFIPRSIADLVNWTINPFAKNGKLVCLFWNNVEAPAHNDNAKNLFLILLSTGHVTTKNPRPIPRTLTPVPARHTRRPDKEILESTFTAIRDHADDADGPWHSLKEMLRVTTDAVNLKGPQLGHCWVKTQWKRVVDSYIVVTRKESGKPMTDTLPSE